MGDCMVNSTIFYGFVFVCLFVLYSYLGLSSGFKDTDIYLIFMWGKQYPTIAYNVSVSVN